MTSYNDILLDGTVLVGLGVGEEDYYDFGHFLSVESTISGGFSNRTASDISLGRYFVVAEPTLVLTETDGGGYSIDTVVEWECSGGTYFSPSWDSFDVDVAVKTTYYKEPVPAPTGCFYFAHNCFVGTPTCGTALPQFVLTILPCAPTTKHEFFFVRIRFSNRFVESCSPGISYPGAGTGACT